MNTLSILPQSSLPQSYQKVAASVVYPKVV
jgi:hypothetical protein